VNLEANSSPPSCPRWEPAGAIFITALFLLINLLVATRTPTVYVDEPQYCDPAANLFLGDGFTSTMWGQGRGDLWCGNVPLYQGVLVGFFKICGFGLFQARAVNSLLAGAGGLLIWAALRRTAFVRQPANRLACLALILSASVTTLTFRTIRPDATMFFTCALVFFACSLPADWRGRYLLVVLASALLPAAGIPMIPYVGMVLLINLAVYGFANLRLLASVAIGLAGGVAALALFYRHFSSLHTFLEIVLPFTGLGGVNHGGTSFLHDKVLGKSFGEENVFTSFFGNPLQFVDQKTLFDHSAALLFLLVLVLSAKAWRIMSGRQRQFMVCILFMTIAVPPVMHLAGHYRSFYRWMTCIPLAIAVPQLLEIQFERAASPWLRRAVISGMCVSVFMGIPLRTLAVIPGWRERSPTPLERVAAQIARPTDVVVCEFKTYFALRPKTKLLYAYGLTARGEFNKTKDLPVNEITLLCLSPKDVEPVTQIIGGKWKKVPLDGMPEAEALAKTRYAVDFYRRDSSQ
jgi:hypothetical protein